MRFHDQDTRPRVELLMHPLAPSGLLTTLRSVTRDDGILPLCAALLLALCGVELVAGCAHQRVTPKAWESTAGDARVLDAALLDRHVLVSQSGTSDEVGASIRLFDRASGRELWECAIPTTLMEAKFIGNENSLFVGTNSYVFSLDLATGNPRWVRGPFEGPLADLSLTADGVAAAFQRDGAVLLSRVSGTVLWAYNSDDAEPLHVVDTADGAFLILRRVAPDSNAIRMDVLPLQQAEQVWSEVLQPDDRIVRSGEWVVIERGAANNMLPSRAVRIQHEEPEETKPLTEAGTVANGQSLVVRGGSGRLLRLRRLFAYDFGMSDVAWQRAWPQTEARLRVLPQREGVLIWPEGGRRAELLDAHGEPLAEWVLGDEDRECTAIEADVDSLLLRCSSGRTVRLLLANRR
ncbi:MAG: hypothetical protein ACI81R_001987 [Bradymonadia bacterium]|jgi:hypothetical protein